MKRIILTISVIPVLLAGCASKPVTIVPFGLDTYIVTGSDGISKRKAQNDAITAANSLCSSKGKEMMPVSMSSEVEAGFYIYDTVSLTFRCLNRGDADLGRPTPEPSADIIVKNIGQ